MYLENRWKGLHIFGKITLSRSWNGIQCACASADCVPLICTIFSRPSESDIAEFMLLEVPHERVTIMEELGRGAFGRVYKSVMRGVPEKNTFSKPKDHSLDSHEGRIVATKVLPGAWVQNMAKKKLTLSASAIHGSDSFLLITGKRASLETGLNYLIQ